MSNKLYLEFKKTKKLINFIKIKKKKELFLFVLHKVLIF